MSASAVIDIGTNSTLLLVGQLSDDGHIDTLHQEFLVTRLGERVHEDGAILPAAMDRTINVLIKYREKLDAMNVGQVNVIGTQALRQAANSSEFAERVQRDLGWDLQIISGQSEAQYSFTGALDAIDSLQGTVAVMDVGGGSSEVICGKPDGTIDAFESLPIGVVRLWEQLERKPALLPEDVDRVLETAGKLFSALPFLRQLKDSEHFIGVGGTITTLVAIRERMRTYDPQKVNGKALSYVDLRGMFSMLNSLPMAERIKLPGLVKGREDVILFGTLIFLAFMHECGFEQVIASDRGLRFGYLKKLLQSNIGKNG